MGRPLLELNLKQVSERKSENRSFVRRFLRDIG
nr:unnamed protein product [Callosobruchus chinensis]